MNREKLSSGSSTISCADMELILEKLKSKSTRDSTARNYLGIWRGFNKFLFKLDSKLKGWENKITLYMAHLVDQGAQSSTIKSYMSALKKVLILDGFELNESLLMASTIARVCRIMNDKVKTCLPIQRRLLDLILFELGGIFSDQYYLKILYKTIIITGYCGLFRIGELTKSPHTIKAKNVHMGINKNKILIMLYTSKTHGEESRPQKIKIDGIKEVSQQNSQKLSRFFCLFMLMRKFLQLRGGYLHDSDQFLGGLSLHLNHLIGSRVTNYDWPFGTLPFGLFGSNLDTRDLETYPRTYFGHF